MIILKNTENRKKISPREEDGRDVDDLDDLNDLNDHVLFAYTDTHLR